MEPTVRRARVNLSPAETAALDEFVAAIRELLGAELDECRLFGSRARGEGYERSDLDVAVIVNAAGNELRYRIYDLAFDLSLEHGVLLAPLVIDRQRLADLRRRERLIALDLDAQGIRL